MNYATEYSFECAHSRLMFARHALIFDVLLPNFSDEDPHPMAHLLHHGFRDYALNPIQWAAYRTTTNAHAEPKVSGPRSLCWRSRFDHSLTGPAEEGSRKHLCAGPSRNRSLRAHGGMAATAVRFVMTYCKPGP